MGLDAVEIVVAMERTFGIGIPDEEVGTIRTVGDMHRLVLKKIELKSTSSCPTMAAYHTHRNILTEVTERSQGDIKPSTEMTALFPLPRAKRRKMWKNLKSNSTLQIPHLVRSPLVKCLGFSIVAVIYLRLFVVTVRSDTIDIWPTALVSHSIFALIALGLYIALTEPLRTMFPTDCGTVRGFIRSVLKLNRETLLRYYSLGNREWTPSTVWDKMVEIIIDIMGVDHEEVTPDARFLEDLGVS